MIREQCYTVDRKFKMAVEFASRIYYGTRFEHLPQLSDSFPIDLLAFTRRESIETVINPVYIHTESLEGLQLVVGARAAQSSRSDYGC